MTLPLSRRAIRRAAFVDFNGVLDGDAWVGRHAHTNRLSPVHVARLDALDRRARGLDAPPRPADGGPA